MKRIFGRCGFAAKLVSDKNAVKRIVDPDWKNVLKSSCALDRFPAVGTNRAGDLINVWIFIG
jgi:hypothetical protein